MYWTPEGSVFTDDGERIRIAHEYPLIGDRFESLDIRGAPWEKGEDGNLHVVGRRRVFVRQVLRPEPDYPGYVYFTNERTGNTSWVRLPLKTRTNLGWHLIEPAENVGA